RRESIALRLPQPLQNSRVRVLDEYGRETPAQRSADGTHVVITPALPPMRVSLFDVQLSAGPTPKNALRITKSTLENENLQVKIDKNGDISSLYDKRLSREMLRKPVRLALFRFDGSPFWPQWELQYSALRRRPAYAAQPQINVLEAGPARVALEITRQARGSTFRQVLSLDAGGTWLRVANEIDWQSPRTLLKIEIPTAASNACATYDLGFGTARRKTNTARQYEVPAQQWADLTDRDGGFGLSVLSDCKAGWDKPDRHTLRLTAVFSPRAGHRGNAAQLDFGRDRFDFALFSHAGGWQNGAVQAGACFNQPLPAYWIPAASPTASPAPAKNEPFGAVGGHIILRALKQAEDGDDWIARLQETDGTPLPEGTLRLGGGILAFREVNGAEEDHHPKNCAVLCGTTLHASFNPYEIRTFRLQVAPMPHAAPLPRPQTLSFEAAPQICGGQTLTINRPHGDAAWLQLAIACKGKDRDTVFLAGGRPHTRRVYSMTEPIAAGDLPGIGVSGYTKPAVPLEEFLRVPGETGDAKPGAQVWFHEVALPFNGKAATLTLPRDNNIVLLWVRVHSTPAVVPANALLDQMERRPVPAVLPAQAPKQRLRALRYRLHQAKNFARHFCEVHFSQKD
ncbi:MAG: glycosyl hydrolase-related protein, partial [Oscillospiraceae bacterium]|nr:glycosyl hydrolase-related protein [Oscillospiraceae bacterium]